MADKTEIRIKQETALQDDVRDLIDQLNAYVLPLAPMEFQFILTAEQMAEPGNHVFVARDQDNQAVGMGTLKQHSDVLGEVKRMFTVAEVRGTGTGAKLLDQLIACAQKLGLSKLVLETGTTDEFQSAWALYESRGFQVCGAFLDYPESDHSRFYEKKLA